MVDLKRLVGGYKRMGKTKRQQVRWEGGSGDDSFDVSNPTGILIPLSKLSS